MGLDDRETHRGTGAEMTLCTSIRTGHLCTFVHTCGLCMLVDPFRLPQRVPLKRRRLRFDSVTEGGSVEGGLRKIKFLRVRKVRNERCSILEINYSLTNNSLTYLLKITFTVPIISICLIQV